MSSAFEEFNMRIGELARRVGLTASTLRYYERERLLPPPERLANRRQYDSRAIGRVRIIQVARSAGFSIAETRAFVANYSISNMPSQRWRAMADRKVVELDSLIERATEMKRILRSSFNCRCSTIDDCEQMMFKSTRLTAAHRKTPT